MANPIDDVQAVDLCSKIFGGLIGGLMNIFSIKNIRAAVAWWNSAAAEETWQMFDRSQKIMRGEICGACGKPGHVAVECPKMQIPSPRLIVPFRKN